MYTPDIYDEPHVNKAALVTFLSQINTFHTLNPQTDEKFQLYTAIYI